MAKRVLAEGCPNTALCQKATCSTELYEQTRFAEAICFQFFFIPLYLLNGMEKGRISFSLDLDLVLTEYLATDLRYLFLEISIN